MNVKTLTDKKNKLDECRIKKCPDIHKASVKQEVEFKKQKNVLDTQLANNKMNINQYSIKVGALIKQRHNSKVTKDTRICNVQKCNAISLDVLDATLTNLKNLAQQLKNKKIITEIQNINTYIKSKPLSIAHYININAKLIDIVDLIGKSK